MVVDLVYGLVLYKWPFFIIILQNSVSSNRFQLSSVSSDSFEVLKISAMSSMPAMRPRRLLVVVNQCLKLEKLSVLPGATVHTDKLSVLRSTSIDKLSVTSGLGIIMDRSVWTS